MGLGGLCQPPYGFRPFLALALTTALLLSACPHGQADMVLEGVPRYLWWSGCAPTSAGMIIGYWNSDLYPFYQGDASVWSSSDARYSNDPEDNLPRNVAAMIGSWEHVHEGYLAGYDTSIGCGKYSPGERDANCIADFMGADNGWVQGAIAIGEGLVDFAAWDNPDTPDYNESVRSTYDLYWTFDSPDPWTVFVAEIDARRPGLVCLRSSGEGHTIAAYGYRTIGSTRYMAVHDTWQYSLDWNPPGAFMEDGVEWWPWTPTWSGGGDWAAGALSGTSLDVPYGSRGWTVDAIITFDPKAVPEPGTLAMVLIGLAAAAGRIARRRRAEPPDGP